jgi:hypothetical protein
MREAIQNLLDLSEPPLWRELAACMACTMFIIAAAVVICLGGIAMGVSQ